jgi:predicted SAM-dependent methyltransferase
LIGITWTATRWVEELVMGMGFRTVGPGWREQEQEQKMGMEFLTETMDEENKNKKRGILVM